MPSHATAFRTPPERVDPDAGVGRVVRLGLLVTAALVLLAAPDRALTQGLPTHTTSALTAGFQENAARSFVRFLGRSGRVGGATRSVDAVVVGNGVIPFSFTPLWTVGFRVPWISKTLSVAGSPDFETSGLGDAVLDTKWIFHRKDRPGGTRRIGVRGGVKIPLSDTDARLPDGRVAPRPLQVGSGSWDVPVGLVYTESGRHWGLTADAGWRFNTGADGFEAGDVFSYDVALGLRFLPWTYESIRDRTLVAYLELNGTVAGKDRVDGRVNSDSGGHVLFVSPDLQWVLFPWLLLEGSVQLPVVQRLNGSQLEHDTRFQLGSRIRFSVFR